MRNHTFLVMAGAVLLTVLLAASSMAISPPDPGTEMPPAIRDVQEIIAQNYGTSGIARKIQKIKEIQRASPEEIRRDFPANFVVPVIMGNYSDNAHIFASSNFDDKLFYNNPTGSISDYFDEVSYGQFALSGNTYGPYTATQTQEYYVYNSNGLSLTYPRNAPGFIVSILQVGDPDIDFTQYDNDGLDGIPNSGDDDGYVDAIIVLHPDGMSQRNDDDNMAAHQWTISYTRGMPFMTDDMGYNGEYIKIDHYTMQPAEKGDGTLDEIIDIGVFCHEFGHILGLPELYDYDNSSNGMGTWALMALGTWGVSRSMATEHHPTHMCAWSKEFLGWINPIDIDATEAVQIPPVETDPVVYRLWEDAYMGSRYFLLENRQAIGFDVDIYGEGVLITHCNNDRCRDNSNDDFRMVDLEEADGLDQLDSKTSNMDDGDPYPGSTNNTSFNDATYPSANDDYGNPTTVSAEDFAYGPGDDVTVTLTPRDILGYTINMHPRTDWLVKWSHEQTPPVHIGQLYETPAPGFLVSVKIGNYPSPPKPYTINIYDDLVNNSPQDLLSSFSGTIPQYYSTAFEDITMPDTVPLIPSETFFVDLEWGNIYEEYIPVYTTTPISGNSYLSADGTDYTQLSDKDVAMQLRVAFCHDSDGDGYADAESDPARCEIDNCPDIYNPGQEDSDDNGIGDVCDYICGDADSDETINILDIVYLINYIYKNGPAPAHIEHSDVNSDLAINILDIVYLINYIYKSGPLPFCLT